MKDLENINRLFAKYKISQSLKSEEKKFIFQSRSLSYAAILKGAGEYSFLRNILFNLEKYLRKFSIRISSSRSKALISSISMATAIVLVLIVSFQYIFSPDLRRENGFVIYSDGPVSIKSKNDKLKKAEIKSIVNSGDNIQTGKDALLIIQMASKAILNIEADTHVEIKKIFIDKTIQLYLSKGLLLSKVKKLRDHSRYIIRTPNCEVEVIGTEFSVRYNNGKSTIALGKGKVRVKNIKSGSVIQMSPGTTLLITGSTKKRPINQKELLELEKTGIIPILDDRESKSIRFFEEKVKQYRLNLTEIDRKIKKLESMREEEYISPLERLRRLGKLIILFHMRDGNTIAGSMITQDEKIIRLDTGAGKITLRKNEILRRKIIE